MSSVCPHLKAYFRVYNIRFVTKKTKIKDTKFRETFQPWNCKPNFGLQNQIPTKLMDTDGETKRSFVVQSTNAFCECHQKFSHSSTSLSPSLPYLCHHTHYHHYWDAYNQICNFFNVIIITIGSNMSKIRSVFITR